MLKEIETKKKSGKIVNYENWVQLLQLLNKNYNFPFNLKIWDDGNLSRMTLLIPLTIQQQSRNSKDLIEVYY